MRILAVTNMYPTPHAPAAGIFVEQQVLGLRQIGLDVELLFVDRLQEGMRTYLALQKRLHHKLDQYRPHIVHVMYGGVMADQVAKIVTDRPLMVTFHGSDLLGEPLSGWFRKCIAAYGVHASWRAARRADHLVVVAASLQEALPADVPRSKVSVIPCGIDLERFQPLDQEECRRRLHWQGERFHVLFPSHPDNAVKRYSLAKAAVDLLARQGVPIQLHPLQGILNTEVPYWLNAADVLLLTSQHEGSPTVIKEALACNLPVVSVAVGDVRERIESVHGCYLASPDANDLAAKLRLVYDRRCRVAGRVTLQEVSLQSSARRLQSCYETLRATHLSAVA